MFEVKGEEVDRLLQKLFMLFDVFLGSSTWHR